MLGVLRRIDSIEETRESHGEYVGGAEQTLVALKF